MKKIYISCIALVSAITMNAQILTQISHAPANGDMYSTQQCDSLISVGPSGANVVWNFSTLNIHASVVANYTTVASTTPSYPSGSQATGSSTNDLAYTLSTANDLKYYGGNIKVETVAATLIYSSPAIAAVYPMSLNTSSSSVTGGSINITAPTAAPGSFTGNSSTLADGSGTLILPGATGTFSNVLRVITTETINFSVAAGFVTGVVTVKNYNYYTPSVKAPILTIISKTVTSTALPTSTQTLVLVNKDYLAPPINTTSISKNLKLAMEISVFPNPSSNFINFETENQTSKDLVIYDITGKTVEKHNFNGGKMKMDVTAYNAGLYFYAILNNSGETLKTGKIAVNH